MNISRQAVHQFYKKALQNDLKATQLIEKATALRKGHPGQGCRKMALKTRECGWGRDKIEQLLLEEGFRIIYPPNYTKTTRPQYDLIFPNLIEGLILSGINQLIQSDITYIWITGRFYYLVLIIDVYSRRIVGYNIGESMEAECNLKALKMMIAFRKGDCLKEMIHHSDLGSQYTSKKYLDLLEHTEIKISMCKEAWKNAYAERLNRTIKSEYLKRMKIDTFSELRSTVKRVITNYNEERSHLNLYHKMSPIEFEKYVDNLPSEKRPRMQLYQGSMELSTI